MSPLSLGWAPSAATEFTAAYVQQEVRKRGENRVPCDLLIDVAGGIARLQRGSLKGRVTRHGYIYHFGGYQRV